MFHSHLLPSVKKIAGILIDAGREILDVYHSREWEEEMKTDGSPLTLADRRAHELIKRELSLLNTEEILPFFSKSEESPPSSPTEGIPLLSEEGAQVSYEERSKWPLFWLVDPLDGTKEFLKRNGEFTVNIALVLNGIPRVGFVYLPVKQTLFAGVTGHGAFRYGPGEEESSIFEHCVPIPSWTGRGQPLRVVASRSHRSRETDSFISLLRDMYGPVEVISSGSSLKLCRIAEGSADVYPRFGPTMEWDTAAAQAVCSAAGAYVVNTETGESLKYNKKELKNPNFLAAREEEILELLLRNRGGG